MKISIVLCTKDRPNDVYSFLISVFYQTVHPDEIIIVDSSELEFASELKKHVTELINMKVLCCDIKIIQTDPGLTKQRNFGVKNVSNDIEMVMFFDDDSILMPEYIEKIVQAAKKEPDIYGFSGITFSKTDKTTIGMISKQYLRSFFMMTNSVSKNFRVLKSFQAAGKTKVSAITKTEYLNGNSSYRKEVFSYFDFDEKLEKYGLMEDLDFSYRVSKKYQLCVVPDAIIFHNHSKRGRLNEYDLGYMRAKNHYYLFKKNIKSNTFNWFKYYISCVGYFLLFINNGFRTKNFSELKGYLNCLRSKNKI